MAYVRHWSPYSLQAPRLLISFVSTPNGIQDSSDYHTEVPFACGQKLPSFAAQCARRSILSFACASIRAVVQLVRH